jgi:hypothetical protein
VAVRQATSLIAFTSAAPGHLGRVEGRRGVSSEQRRLTAPDNAYCSSTKRAASPSWQRVPVRALGSSARTLYVADGPTIDSAAISLVVPGSSEAIGASNAT